MRSIEIERQTFRKLAAQFLGEYAGTSRVHESQSGLAGSAAAILALPIDADSWAPIQDSETGEFFFIAGVSDPDGPDLLM